jgi:2-keto-3-deoxy-L-fuconate dehydrogenase
MLQHFNLLRYVHNGTIFDCSDEDWDRSFNVNIKSMFWMTKAFLPKVNSRVVEVFLLLVPT